MTDLNELREQLKPIFWDVFDPDSETEGNVQAALDKAMPIIALAAVSDTTPSEPQCTCPSGDGSLRWPCPAHPPTPSEGEREALTVDAMAQILCRIEGRRTGRSFDEVVAPGIELWTRHRYEAEQLIDELSHAGLRLTPPAPVDGEVTDEQVEAAARAYDPEAWSHYDQAREEGRAGLDGMVAYSLRKGRAALESALAVSPAPARDEWEYGAGLVSDPQDATAHADRLSAGKAVAGWNESVRRMERQGSRNSGPAVVVRRRPAGPWLPVTEEE